MNSDIARLSRLWRDQGDAFIDQVCEDILAHSDTSYHALSRNLLRTGIKQMVDAWHAALDADNPEQLLDFSRRRGMQRAGEGVEVDDMMLAIDSLRRRLWELIDRLSSEGGFDINAVRQLESWLHEERKAIVSSYGQILRESRERLNEREQALESQRQLIQELSTPIVPIYEGVLVLPLVGAIDSRRATQIMEAALEQIVTYQSDILILDITGVPVVDTGVANHLLQMARAVTLLGARVVLVGIGAEIAQTIVQLGVDLRDITTLADLQAGIAYALAQQGFEISPMANVI
jgi:rsbT co-antagonist protein RsbR